LAKPSPKLHFQFTDFIISFLPFDMADLFVRKDVLRDTVTVVGNLVAAEEGANVPAVLAQFRHKLSRQRIFCILLTERNFCCIMDSEVDVEPKPFVPCSNRADKVLTISRSDGKYLALTFHTKFGFMNWQKCVSEVIAEVQCCEAMKPLPSGRLSAARMGRCVSLCRLLTREAALVQQVKRLCAVRHKVNETMKLIKEQECKLNQEDVRKVKTGCSLIRSVYPSLRLDPDLVFLTEQLQGDKHSDQDLQNICRLLLHVEQEDQAEFLRMVRRSSPSGGAVGATALPALMKPVPVHRATVVTSPNPSPRKISKEGEWGGRSPVKRSPTKRSSLKVDTARDSRSVSSGSASPVPRHSLAQTPTIAQKARKSVTWDVSVQPSDKPRIPRTASKRNNRRQQTVQLATAEGDTLATSATAGALQDNKENGGGGANISAADSGQGSPLVTDRLAVVKPPSKTTVAQRGRGSAGRDSPGSETGARSPVAKPVPSVPIVLDATAISPAAARRAQPHATGVLTAVGDGQSSSRGAATVDFRSLTDAHMGFECGGVASPSQSVVNEARVPTAAPMSTPHTARQPDRRHHLALTLVTRCLSLPLLWITLLLAAAALCTLRLAPLLSLSYSATHFTPGTGYTSLTFSLGGVSGGSGTNGNALVKSPDLSPNMINTTPLVISSPMVPIILPAMPEAEQQPPKYQQPSTVELSTMKISAVNDAEQPHIVRPAQSSPLPIPVRLPAPSTTAALSRKDGRYAGVRESGGGGSAGVSRGRAGDVKSMTELDPFAISNQILVGEDIDDAAELHLQVLLPGARGDAAVRTGTVQTRAGGAVTASEVEVGAGAALKRVAALVLAPLRWLRGALRYLRAWALRGEERDVSVPGRGFRVPAESQ
jgi:hypothetical protein